MNEVVINVTKVEEVVTINATPNITQILVNTNTSGGGGIPEAPNNTNAYVRSGLAWVIGYTKTAIDNLLNGKFNTPNGNSSQYLDGTGTPTTFPTIPSISGLATETYVDNGLANKVDKETGKSLILDTEISRLASMTAIFTTALKTAYDDAVSWISTNGTNVLNHLTRTDNPHSVTKSQVGLSNVDNTSDENKPVSTAQATADSNVQTFSINRANHIGTQLASTISDFATQVNSLITSALASFKTANFLDFTSSGQTQIDSKAPLASPSLTGTPTAPTAPAGTNTTQVATTAFVKQEINNVATNSVPGIMKLFTSTGSATDGTMTQKSVTDALDLKVDLSTQFVKSLASNFSTTSTANTNTNLSFPIGANEVWYVAIDLEITTGTSTTGMRYQISAPVGAVVEGSMMGFGATATTVLKQRINFINSQIGALNTGGAATTDNRGFIRIRNGATPGTVSIGCASNTNGTASTILSGSTIRANKTTEV